MFLLNKEELIEWFDEKLMNCYHIVRENGDIIWVYDKNYIRKLKLAEIDGIKIDPPVYDKNKVLFYQDQKNKWFECESYMGFFRNSCNIQTIIQTI